ncbi:ATP-grasp fold amidoligase family protein [Blastococcus sp. TF02-9]|uniref:ATP-grasp fold amidoligase family protein n=1 Tax=Blastococcus sp. TF02-09 TaxID=2250576 RepID=UPI00131461AF|nr:ATP-grasp fold amidoligase family protein [Blastococcus sp. TF02-9]
MVGLVAIRTARNPARTLQILSKWGRDRRCLPLRLRPHLLDYIEIHHFMASRLGRYPNLQAPRDFNDKIQWLKLFARQAGMAKLVDKVAVREWVANRIGPQYLIPLRDTAERWSRLDPSALRAPFVVKTAHDSGSTVIVTSDDPHSILRARTAITRAQRRRYGTVGAEWAYRDVRARVLVEEMIGNGTVPPADYKFFCVRGEVKLVQKLWGRFEGTLKEATFDASGSSAALHVDPTNAHEDGGPLPGNWQEMLSVASALSMDFEFVRVDLFSIGGKVFFGELTFWPYSGYYLGDQRALGGLIEVDNQFTGRTAPGT